MLIRIGAEERLKPHPEAIILLDSDGVCNNEQYYKDVFENKTLFKPHRMTAGNSSVCEMFKKEGFNCYHLSEVAFRKYEIRNKKQRKGLLNIAPARMEKDLSRRTREVYGHEIIEYGRLKEKIFDIMAESKIGVINGRNNSTLSFFDALSCGLPVLLPSDIRICPEFLLMPDNHHIYKDAETFKEGIEKLSNVNRDKIINDFVANTENEIQSWKKMLGVPTELDIKMIRL
jgi:hypothetical protein